MNAPAQAASNSEPHAAQPDDHSELSRAVHAALEHAHHLLPDQAPIRVFIHHNTLHAFQHLHFHDAVLAGHQVYGAEPYASEAYFRERMKAGRITHADLDAALEDQFFGAQRCVFLDGALDDLEIRRLMLRFQFQRETDATLAWQEAEQNLARQLRADVPTPAREHLLRETERDLRATLERGDVEGLLRFARLVAGTQNWEQGAQAISDEYALTLDPVELSNSLREDPEPFCVRALFCACLELTDTYVARDAPAPALRLHRDLLLEQDGSDVFDVVLPELIRLCAAYLDEGLAAWSMPRRELGFYRAARALCVDGSRPVAPFMRRVRADFQRQLERAATPMQVVEEVLSDLGVSAEQAQAYVERLLLTLPGWGGMMSRLERKPDDRPHGGPPAALLELLAVRLVYERAALQQVTQHRHTSPRALWQAAFAAPEPQRAPARSSRLQAAYQLFQLVSLAGLGLGQVRSLSREQANQIVDAIEAFDSVSRRRVFLEAFEHHHRTQVLDAVAALRTAGGASSAPSDRQPLQLVCCFDEREESFRRHIEELWPEVATFGAPGFFGAAMRFRALDQAHHVPLAPVVINPVHHIEERPISSDLELHAARVARRKRWARVQSELFAGSRSLWRGLLLNVALGSLAALPLLLRIASPRVAGRVRRFAGELLLPSPRTELTVHRDSPADDPKLRGFDMDERVTRVAAVLQNIGLVRDFAPAVVVLGHGSTTLNNPHKSAYDCGACGGRQGGPNARVFATMANTPEVRAGLVKHGIVIPEDTFFIGGQHDTCSDGVTLFDLDRLTPEQRERFKAVLAAIDRTRARNAQERCRRLFSAPSAPSPEAALRHVQGRSEHLAEPRPEFGHATNAVAVIGRRSLTRGLFLDRRAFLLSYDPSIDDTGAILERTLAAATPVGAGINLEYYFSHVDNEHYGAGSKLPHNASGLLGVMTGHASDLRTGLPRQMIEIHEAVRLLILVEATPERLLDIAGRQAEVREFVVNRWVQLVSVHPETGAMQVFTDRGFQPYVPRAVQLEQHASSFDAFRGQREFVAPSRILGGAPRAA